MDKRLLGFALIIIGFLTLFSSWNSKKTEDFLIDAIIELNNGSCVMENDYCLHMDRSQTHYYLGLFTSLVLIILGVLSLYEAFVTPKRTDVVKTVTKTKEPPGLDEEEKTVYDIVKENEGSVFQSDIVKQTSYSKVKVTRVLDRLENKKLVERRRRGMANLIVLK